MNAHGPFQKHIAGHGNREKRGAEVAAILIINRVLEKAASIPHRTLRALAAHVGAIWYRLDRKHRDVAMRNLEMAWGEELTEAEKEAICRKVFVNLSTVMLELPYLLTLTRENLGRFITFSGVEHLENAQSKGKGVLVLASHFGNWELMSLAFSLRHQPIKVVVRPLDNHILDAIINTLRSRGGNELIPKKGSVRQILRHLRRNQVVALLADQNVDWYDGVFVPFFNEIACTNKAMAVLALRTGAPVVPVYNYRQEDGRYATVFEPEIPIIRTADTTGDIEENAACFNRVIEGFIRRYPEQWLWLHMRWKTRPYQLWPRQSLKGQRWLVIRPQIRSLEA